MGQSITFKHFSSGLGRPQVLLIGNGLEKKSGQASWEQLLDRLTVKDALTISKEQKECIPFPLLYQLLSTHMDGGSPYLNRESVLEEERRLRDVMNQLTHQSNELLDLLPSLNADHIFTTNYSYCTEQAFFPSADFSKAHIRNYWRFRLKKPNSKQTNRENCYRLHSGYIAKSSKRNTGIWHIHGECGVPGGIVLSHDRYGRLLQRIEEVCRTQDYSSLVGRPAAEREFTSWPELFLYGDVYILGLTLSENEFDLWWLLRRKQREYNADGSVFFYEPRPEGGFQEGRHLLFQVTGVKICDLGFMKDGDYDSFYRAALEDIRQRIAVSRPSVS